MQNHAQVRLLSGPRLVRLCSISTNLEKTMNPVARTCVRMIVSVSGGTYGSPPIVQRPIWIPTNEPSFEIQYDSRKESDDVIGLGSNWCGFGQHLRFPIEGPDDDRCWRTILRFHDPLSPTCSYSCAPGRNAVGSSSQPRHECRQVRARKACTAREMPSSSTSRWVTTRMQWPVEPMVKTSIPASANASTTSASGRSVVT